RLFRAFRRMFLRGIWSGGALGGLLLAGSGMILRRTGLREPAHEQKSQQNPRYDSVRNFQVNAPPPLVAKRGERSPAPWPQPLTEDLSLRPRDHSRCPPSLPVPALALWCGPHSPRSSWLAAPPAALPPAREIQW